MFDFKTLIVAKFPLPVEKFSWNFGLNNKINLNVALFEQQGLNTFEKNLNPAKNFIQSFSLKNKRIMRNLNFQFNYLLSKYD